MSSSLFAIFLIAMKLKGLRSKLCITAFFFYFAFFSCRLCPEEVCKWLERAGHRHRDEPYILDACKTPHQQWKFLFFLPFHKPLPFMFFSFSLHFFFDSKSLYLSIYLSLSFSLSLSLFLFLSLSFSLSFSLSLSLFSLSLSLSLSLNLFHSS